MTDPSPGTALVTGGSGYFGALVTEQLRGRGWKVRVLDLNDVDDRHRDVEFIRGDIRDGAVVHEACRGVDVVFNNVAQVPLAKDVHLLNSVNIEGTALLLARRRRDRGQQGRAHLVECGVRCTRAQSGASVNRSGATRNLWTGEARRRVGVPGGRLPRPRRVDRAAANDHGTWAVGHLRHPLRLDRGRSRRFVFGNGANRYQFVHADDLADLTIRAGERSGPGIFNGGTDRFGTMRETLESVCAHAGTGSRVRSLPARPASLAMQGASKLKLAPFAPYHWIMYSKSMWFDIEHCREQLGWTPTWSNEEMFAQSYDWYLAHRAEAESHAPGRSHHRQSTKQGALKLLKAAVRLLPNGHRALS